MNPGLKALLRPPVIIGAVAVLSVAAVLLAFVYTTPSAQASYVNPTVGTIVEEVDTTGSVKAAQSVDLSFQTSGRISYVNATEGAHVGLGTVLARTDSANLQAQVEQARAALQAQQAKLDALQVGARPEDVAVSQAAVTGAQSALSQAKETLLEAARDAYVKSDDAIHNKVDQFFNNPRTSSPTLVFSLNDSQLQTSIGSGRVSIETLLNGWQTYVTALPVDSDQANIADVGTKTQSYLSSVSAYLDQVAAGLTAVIANSTYPNATIQGYQSSVATGRANISTALSALNVGETAEKAAESALASAQSQLTLKQAPATTQDIEAQQAQVAEAKANVDAALAQLGNAEIVAPFSGVITNSNAHLGQTATPGSPLISMISDAQFQIETYVSEADLAKLKVGDEAQVQLDAYSNDPPFSAHVVSIDPAATVQNGIASYKVELSFDQNNPKILAGLTGNIKIITQTKSNALSVPSSAVITRGNNQYVLRASSSGGELVQVTTGITSANGMTEITSGLSSSDRVRSFGVQQ